MVCYCYQPVLCVPSNLIQRNWGWKEINWRIKKKEFTRSHLGVFKLTWLLDKELLVSSLADDESIYTASHKSISLKSTLQHLQKHVLLPQPSVCSCAMAGLCICYFQFDGQLQNRQYDNFHTWILLSESSIAPVCKLTKGPKKAI